MDELRRVTEAFPIERLELKSCDMDSVTHSRERDPNAHSWAEISPAVNVIDAMTTAHDYQAPWDPLWA